MQNWMKTDGNMPILSIIVCTYNRDRYIEETLILLSDQSIEESHYEVLIIDNNSTDDTTNKCRNLIKRSGFSNFHYFLETNQGHTYSRNRGIKESSGHYLAFLDDDAWVNRHYCEEIIHFFDNQKDATAIGGKIIPEYESKEPVWMSRYLWPLVAGLDMGNQVREFKGSQYPIGANMAYRSQVFSDYGMFNIDLGRRGKGLEGGDEKDMIFRLKTGGERVFYVPSVKVRHIIPGSRTTISYIRGQAIGVGISEKKRLSHSGLLPVIIKSFSELIKIGATCVLGLFYLFTFRPAKGIMLIRFRTWVIQGYLSYNK